MQDFPWLWMQRRELTTRTKAVAISKAINKGFGEDFCLVMPFVGYSS